MPTPFDYAPAPESRSVVDIAPFEVFRSQLSLAGSHSLNHNIPRSLEIIASLGSEIDRAVSHRLPLEEISTILANKPPRDSLKVQWARD